MIERRSQAVELLTGVDSEVAGQIVEEAFANGDRFETAGVVARLVPPRSLYTAMHATGNSAIANELEAMPGAADAINRLIYATWEFCFVARRNIRDVEIRDARYVEATGEKPDQFFATLTALAPSGERVEGLPKNEGFWRFICARNEQLADVYEHTAGAREACVAVVAAIRQRAIRSGWPINQTGMRNGLRLPTPTGAELHFEFYRATPRP